jgi:hypothetical protein
VTSGPWPILTPLPPTLAEAQMHLYFCSQEHKALCFPAFQDRATKSPKEKAGHYHILLSQEEDVY